MEATRFASTTVFSDFGDLVSAKFSPARTWEFCQATGKSVSRALLLFSPHPLAAFLTFIHFDTAIDGTVVHPSVYFLLDTYASLGIEKAIGALKPHLEPFREQLKYLHNGEVALSDPWIRDIQHPDSSCRILICGNTGVGKSTLLNEVFGIPMAGVPLELSLVERACLLTLKL